MKPVRDLGASLAIVGLLAIGVVAAPVTDREVHGERPTPEGSRAGRPATVAAGPRVARDVLATAVVDREPVPVSFPISAEVGRLSYFTEIVEAGSATTVLHLWYWRNRNVSVVLLKANGPRFRTWSHKTIPPAWTGEWRVEARTPDGTILSSKTFRVEPADQMGRGETSPRR
jgi:hypothetical protein